MVIAMIIIINFIIISNSNIIVHPSCSKLPPFLRISSSTFTLRSCTVECFEGPDSLLSPLDWRSWAHTASV